MPKELIRPNVQIIDIYSIYKYKLYICCNILILQFFKKLWIFNFSSFFVSKNLSIKCQI
jgi:hypothetical protein